MVQPEEILPAVFLCAPGMGDNLAVKVRCALRSRKRDPSHTITDKRLAQAGYYSILDRYESLH